MWEIQLFGSSLTLHYPDPSRSWSYSISYRDLPASSWLFGATRAALGFSCNDPGMGQAWSSHVFRAPSLSRILWNMPSSHIKPPKTMCWICFNRFQHFVCLNMRRKNRLRTDDLIVSCSLCQTSGPSGCKKCLRSQDVRLQKFTMQGMSRKSRNAHKIKLLRHS